jgi:Glycosyl hydrolases family 43
MLLLKYKKSYSIVFFLFVTVFISAQQVTINNQNPRLDTKGNIVDAHDGRIIQFGKAFYWYGTKYGNTNGFTQANEYVCYSSNDLKIWKYEGALLQQKLTGVYYRPHVVYNARTKKYVLWYNWYPKLWDGQFGVATSDKPTGPFTIVNDNVKVKQNALGVGDLGVFVNDDSKAYLSYNTITNHKVSVELLNEDYTASTLQGSEFIAEHCEAGSMFKHNGLYYLLTDYTCCFCTQGSGAQVFTASNPLGPYAHRQNINRYPGEIAAVLNDGFTNDNLFETLEPKQQHSVEIWFDKTTTLSSIIIQQFTGNRSGQCGEVDNPVLHQPILQHQFVVKYFGKGEWKALGIQPAVAVKKSSMQTMYQIKFNSIQAERLQIQPLYKDTIQSIFLSEINFPGIKTAFRSFKTGKQPGRPIIPAQQTFVMPLQTSSGLQFIWMGDLWGSAMDNVKGHDYQFWSKPLKFYRNGLIKPLQWVNQYQIIIKR